MTGQVTDQVNEKVYIHEFIDIIGQNRAKYMHHMLANWSPIGQEERHQLCWGVFGEVGSTRRWPEVVNIWEEDGFEGLAGSFAIELNNPTLQDPKLAKWWAEAANYRSGGYDRIVVPAPWMPTIEQLCDRGVHGEVFAHEMYQTHQGGARDFLQAVADESIALHERFGWTMCGAWHTAMVNESECILVWSIPTWQQWAEVEGTRNAPTPGWRSGATAPTSSRRTSSGS